MGLEKYNVWCNYQAKDLVRSHWNDTLAFQFCLSSPTILYAPSSTILSSHQDITTIISLQTASSYLRPKLKLNEYFNHIDWFNRISAFESLLDRLSI